MPIETAIHLVTLSAALLAASSVIVLTVVLVKRVVEDLGWQRRRQQRAAIRERIGRFLAGEDDALDQLDEEDIQTVDLLEEIVRLFPRFSPAEQARLRKLASHLDVERVRAMFHRRSRRKQLWAVYLLSFFSGPLVIETLLSALRTSRDLEVRHAAAKALSHQDALPAARELLRLLDAGEKEFSRLTYVVFRRIPPERLHELVDLLRPSNSPKLRHIAVDGMGFGDPVAVKPHLVRALMDPDMEVRAAALRGIGRLGIRGVTRAVVAALDDPAWQVQTQACFCAGRLKLRSAVPRLNRLLAHSEWWVRFRAAEALYAIGGEARASLKLIAGRPDASGRVAQTVILEQEAA